MKSSLEQKRNHHDASGQHQAHNKDHLQEKKVVAKKKKDRGRKESFEEEEEENNGGEIKILHSLSSEEDHHLIVQLVDLYEKNWWSRGRKLENVKRMVQACSNVALVLVDKTTKKTKTTTLGVIIDSEEEEETNDNDNDNIAEEEEAPEVLVGYARIITDTVFKAFVFDVIVREEYQGIGLGRRLVNAIVNHPDIQNVQHMELYCLPEMEPFYEKWGFRSGDFGRIKLMRRTTTN